MQAQRLTQSTPGSPQEHGRVSSFEVIGSAESLVGRVSNVKNTESNQLYSHMIEWEW